MSLFVGFVSELCFLEFAEQASAGAGIASMLLQWAPAPGSGARRLGVK